MKKNAVIGLGNPLRRDDGIGISVLKRLDEIKKRLPADTEFIDGGTGGFNLFHIISKYNSVLIIDGIYLSLNPGESKLFNFYDIESSKKKSLNISTHEEDFLKIISIARKINNKPEKIYIYGIQPKNTGLGNSLSKEIKKNIGKYTRELEEIINDLFVE
ncbi:MAG: hydrogenase maturation protease [Candidatus Thermoplasmatota archaeon]